MIPNAAFKVLARRVIRPVSLWLLAAFALVSPAWAGDKANFNALGYDEKGQFFAFEEFGVSDGAGLAYDSIYVIDVKKDAWVLGTPVRLQAVDESETLAGIRARAMAKAQPVLTDLGIDAPADPIALIGDGMLDTDAKSLSFGIPSFREPGAVDGRFTLTLVTAPAASTAPCETWFESKPLGFRLTLAGDGPDRLLHADTNLPQSRGCPTAYRLYGVFLPVDAADLSSAVVIISVFPHGFEGPDRRFLAVPLAKP